MKYSEVLEKNIFGIKIGFILELLCWIFVICIFIVVIKKMGSWLPKWNTERKKKNQLQKMRSKTKDLSEEEKKILRGVFVYRAVKIDSLVENIEGVQKLKDKNIISFYRPLNDNVNRYEIDHEWFNFLNNNRNLLEIDSDSL